MQMKKHFLAAALALGVGVGAASALPAADMQPPTAQMDYITFTTFVLPALRLIFWKDSAGCGPYDLNVHCTGTPAFPGDPAG